MLTSVVTVIQLLGRLSGLMDLVSLHHNRNNEDEPHFLLPCAYIQTTGKSPTLTTIK